MNMRVERALVTLNDARWVLAEQEATIETIRRRIVLTQQKREPPVTLSR